MNSQMRGSWYIKENDTLIQTVPDPPHTPEVEALFAEALSRIQKTAAKALGQEVDISSIAIPQHFNDSSKMAVSDAALRNQKGIVQRWQVRPFFRTVQAAYGLNTCESLRLDPGCDIEDDTHLVMFIDCNEDSIDVVVADVDSDAFHVLDKRRVGGPKHGKYDHFAPVMIIKERESEGKQNAHTQPPHLTAEHIGRRAELVEGEVEGGGIQHDQAEHHQRHDRQDQWNVHAARQPPGRGK